MMTRSGAWGIIVCALAGCSPETPDPAARLRTIAGADPVRGMALVTQFQCGSCHEIPRVPASRGTLGPSLDAFGRRSYIAGHIPNTPTLLVSWLQDPPAMVPGTLMPAMGISADDARDMASFLLSLE